LTKGRKGLGPVAKANIIRSNNQVEQVSSQSLKRGVFASPFLT